MLLFLKKKKQGMAKIKVPTTVYTVICLLLQLSCEGIGPDIRKDDSCDRPLAMHPPLSALLTLLFPCRRLQVWLVSRSKSPLLLFPPLPPSSYPPPPYMFPPLRQKTINC